MSVLRSNKRSSARIATAAAVFLWLGIWTSAGVAAILVPHSDVLLLSLVLLGFAPYLISIHLVEPRLERQDQPNV
jgi:hypothetical protein